MTVWRLGWQVGPHAKRRIAALLQTNAGSGAHRCVVQLHQRLFPDHGAEHRLAALLRNSRSDSATRSVPGRVVLVNNGLAAGGAERQLINTLAGLAAAVHRGDLESVSLATDPLPADGSRSFYLPRLSSIGITHRQIPASPDHLAEGFAAVTPSLTALLGKGLAEQVLAYAEFFREQRPEVAHIWQDWTNCLAGLGAAIAGVPRILLSTRNISPEHFAYWQPFLRPSYRALLAQPGIALCNNSQAGADDYARWLDIEPARIGVLRNGVAFAGRDAAIEHAAMRLRRDSGIPLDAPVIGSVFRFWPEKRPDLWLRTARLIAKRRPDVHFLIAGWGPLVERTRAAANRAGLGGRFVIAEARQDVAAAICAADVFLLTSRAEGTPNVVLEASMLGVPVVATDAGGTAETVREGVTGSVERDRPACLARAALAWLEDGAARQRVREAGPCWIAEKYGFDRMVAETLAAYGRLGGKSR